LPSQLSIGARWTLRYATATFVLIALFAVYVYLQLQRRLIEDARLVLRLQAEEIVEALRRHPGDREALASYVDQHVESGDPDLKIGIQVFDPSGAAWVRGGTLAGAPVALPGRRPTSSGDLVFHELDLGESYPYVAVLEPAGDYLVQVAIYGRPFVRRARDLGTVLLISLPPGLLIVTAIGWWLARQSLRPISEITEAARRISGADLHEQIPTRGSGDEIDRLAATLNQMIDRIRESVEHMRRFSAHAAHQLRTPLSALRSRIEVTLEKERTIEEYRRALADTLEEVELLGDGVQAMLRLASSEAGLAPDRRGPVALRPVLRSVTDFFEPFAEEHGVKVELGEVPEVRVLGDPDWLHQLFANLLHNAIQYTPAGGTVSIFGKRGDRSVVVAVHDTGVGIDPVERERIFERFYRPRESQSTRGIGLGLPLALEIARAHGGTIELASTPGKGSIFTVWLPLANPDA
jgi:heavy metal sensor kinase